MSALTVQILCNISEESPRYACNSEIVLRPVASKFLM